MSDLSKKQEGFVNDYIETGNGTKAALNNYDVKNERVAASIACENLTKPYIVDAIEEKKRSIAEQIPDDLLVQKHLELLNAEVKVRVKEKGAIVIEQESIDTYSISKGLDMAYKLKGTYAPEKNLTLNVNVEVSDKIKAIAKKAEEELIKEELGNNT